MISLKYKSILEAWENINERCICGDPELLDTPHCTKYLLCGYDVTIQIKKSTVPFLDFGRLFFYTHSKWSNLIGNYLDSRFKDFKEKVREELNKPPGRRKDVTYQFANNHKNGKGCLLSMLISFNRIKPHITFFLRSSEVTKRLILDLILFSRLGKLLLNTDRFQMTIHIASIFNEMAVISMYNTHKSIESLKDQVKTPKIYKAVLEEMNGILKKTKSNRVRYKIHRRVWRCISKYNTDPYPKFTSLNCNLINF